MRIASLLMGTALALCLVPLEVEAGTPSGFDTGNGVDLVFAVSGNQVGDWGLAQMTITGGLSTSSGIQTGYDTAPCNGTIEGTQRYNISIHNYEYCNGTAWVPLGQSDPSGEVAFFLAYSCPTGWNPSDGTNGTVDMRGEFPRGWDNGRGVDLGRGLASWEDATGIGQTVFQAAYVEFINPDSTEWYGGQISRAGLNGYVDNQVVFKVRPRNIALLACSKI